MVKVPTAVAALPARLLALSCQKYSVAGARPASVACTGWAVKPGVRLATGIEDVMAGVVP